MISEIQPTFSLLHSSEAVARQNIIWWRRCERKDAHLMAAKKQGGRMGDGANIPFRGTSPSAKHSPPFSTISHQSHHLGTNPLIRRHWWLLSPNDNSSSAVYSHFSNTLMIILGLRLKSMKLKGKGTLFISSLPSPWERYSITHLIMVCISVKFVNYKQLRQMAHCKLAFPYIGYQLTCVEVTEGVLVMEIHLVWVQIRYCYLSLCCNVFWEHSWRTLFSVSFGIALRL